MNYRPYQVKATEMLYKWFKANRKGNPCLVMPGGSGKSLVIAKIIKDVMAQFPSARVLMLVHSKELILQNYDKLVRIWPNAPVGIYSASVGRRELDDPVIYAGIQSIAKVIDKLKKIDVIIVDEAHSISNTESGTYRSVIKALTKRNKGLRVIGLTASPYRLGQGLVTEGKDALFSDLIEPVKIEELLKAGHLMPLRSKMMDHVLETDGIRKSRGDFVAKAMEQAWNTDDHNIPVVQEIIDKGERYKHWLIFCSGVEHAHDVAKVFRDHGVSADAVTGQDPKAVRDAKIRAFENGNIRALCNVGILTTGYDFPDLDLIAFLRATTSPGLYLQMAVRGMRLKSHTDHCAVLDFAGNVRRHGPITDIQPPKSKSKPGEAPVKICPECDEIVLQFATECPSCGFHFPAKEKEPPKLHQDDIMGLEPNVMDVSEWHWKKRRGKKGIEMITATYYGGLLDRPITEYFTINHNGDAGTAGRRKLATIMQEAGINPSDDVISQMNAVTPPKRIAYKINGRFPRVTKREW